MSTPEQDPEAALLSKLGGKWVVQALSTAAQLGLADALDEPLDAPSLAIKLSCHAGALERLLRVLVGEGALAEDRRGRFSLTPMGTLLRSGAYGPLAAFVGSEPQWRPWGSLTHAVRTGESAFEHVHGRSLYAYLESEPQHAELYDHAVDAFTARQATALALDPALESVRTLVDVGGGRGTLLLALLRARPELRGVLFDRPHVIAAARSRFEADALGHRCSFSEGDFFESIPLGHDAYVLKHVLHNWDDARAAALLERCARALAPGGKILIVDTLLVPVEHRDPGRLLDLEMLVLTGSGRERSKPEMRHLLRTAGLRLEATRMLAPGAWLMVARPRN